MMNLKIRYIFWLNTYLNSKYRKQSVDYCKASAETGIKQGTFQKNSVYFKTVGTYMRGNNSIQYYFNFD
jgi:hypothetical protein